MKKIKFLLIGFVCLFMISCDYIITTSTTTEETEATVYEIQTTITDVVESVEHSSVGILNNGGDCTGSGVIFYELDGYLYVLTNYHVVENYESLYVYMNDSKYISATLLAYDSNVDLACLKIAVPTSEEYSVATIYEDEIVTVGQTCIAIGSPLGFDHFNSVAVGYVGCVYSDFIQHSAPINSGNSGGALFNISGRLIGINVSKIVNSSDGVSVSGMCFAITISEVIDFLDYYNIEWCADEA